MKIYCIAEESPQEYGYNLTYDKRVADVDWDEPDLQMGTVWDEQVVKQFLGLPDDAIVYRTLADVNDLNESLVEEEDENEGGYDWSKLQMSRSYPPPIVITRKLDDLVVINDGNHRARFWREIGKEYIPAWCYDEKITEWAKQNKVSNPDETD